LFTFFFFYLIFLILCLQKISLSFIMQMDAQQYYRQQQQNQQQQQQRQQSLRLRGPRPIPTPLRRKAVAAAPLLAETEDIDRFLERQAELRPAMAMAAPATSAPAAVGSEPRQSISTTVLPPVNLHFPAAAAVVPQYQPRRPVSAIYSAQNEVVTEFSDLTINNSTNNNSNNNNYNGYNSYANGYGNSNDNGTNSGNYYPPVEEQEQEQQQQQQHQHQHQQQYQKQQSLYAEPAPPAVPPKDSNFQQPVNTNRFTYLPPVEPTFHQESEPQQYDQPQQQEEDLLQEEKPKTPQILESDWRNTIVTPDIPAPQLPPDLPPLRLRSSRPPSPYKKGALDLNASQWRYHIQKNLRDFYLTTNPDSDHIHCPVGPSYYVDMHTLHGKDQRGPDGQPLFTLTLLDPITEVPKISVRRGFVTGVGGGGEYFSVTLYTAKGQVDWEAAATAISVAPATPGREPEHGALNSLIGGKKKHSAVRQFVFKDPVSGIPYVVGNRSDGHRLNLSIKAEEDEEFEVDEDDNNGAVRSGKKSTKVYFYRPAAAGDAADKVLAVLQRRKQFHKKLMKDLASFDTKRLLTSSPNKRADAYGGDGVIDDGEDDTANFGWLTLFEAVRSMPQPGIEDRVNRDHLWQLVVALTFAVSYSQRVDTKVRSVGEKLKKLGRKYKDGRFQVIYGHRHSQSLV
jgi:hypothetical protein